MDNNKALLNMKQYNDNMIIKKELINCSHFGEFYKTQLNDGNVVAIKYVNYDPKYYENIKEELDELINVTNYYNLKEYVSNYYTYYINKDNGLAIITSYIDGYNLLQLINLQIYESSEDKYLYILKILKHILQTLKYLHSIYIVHGDIQPENIMFNLDSDIPILVDFAFTYKISFNKCKTTKYIEKYLSPKLLSNINTSNIDNIFYGSIVSEEDDIWALGITILSVLGYDKDNYNHNLKCVNGKYCNILKNLINNMLIENENDRLHAYELLDYYLPKSINNHTCNTKCMKYFYDKRTKQYVDTEGNKIKSKNPLVSKINGKDQIIACKLDKPFRKYLINYDWDYCDENINSL